ncbi:MAG: transglycosylase SLT domain-containing protein [Rubrivivax sp.]|nr:transglycosylase SLT domain-containing protein [Rubrivivax sp.]
MNAIGTMRSAGQASGRSLAVFLRDVGNGLLEISHNTLALMGLAVAVALVLATGRAELRHQVEVLALDWLQNRHEERVITGGDLLALVREPGAVSRATAVDPKLLSQPQAAVAQWIAKRYRVAPEPISRLVQEAWTIGHKAGLDPTLILAIMAVESSFNPFAQSSMGAQGLMQVLTRVHDDKYLAFGGNHAAFDPISNLRVGVQVLRDCIARAGSLHDGLRYYVGAAQIESDGGYVGRVLAEQGFMRHVANGGGVPTNVSNNLPPPKAAALPVPPPAVERVAMLP